MLYSLVPSQIIKHTVRSSLNSEHGRDRNVVIPIQRYKQVLNVFYLLCSALMLKYARAYNFIDNLVSVFITDDGDRYDSCRYTWKCETTENILFPTCPRVFLYSNNPIVSVWVAKGTRRHLL